jgi:ElaA protein
MLSWKWCRFDGLAADEVYDVLALRARVFVVEQTCPYLDVDGLDRDAWHLVGRDVDGALRAYLRVVDPGRKFDEPSIGRVVVDPALRGTGAGHALLAEGLRRCDEAFPGQVNRIGAQARLQAFYEAHGYVVVTEVYLEDDIPHVDMTRAAR